MRRRPPASGSGLVCVLGGGGLHLRGAAEREGAQPGARPARNSGTGRRRPRAGAGRQSRARVSAAASGRELQVQVQLGAGQRREVHHAALHHIGAARDGLRAAAKICGGEVPEWTNGTLSKSVVASRSPWVRIPPSPPKNEIGF